MSILPNTYTLELVAAGERPDVSCSIYIASAMDGPEKVAAHVVFFGDFKKHRMTLFAHATCAGICAGLTQACANEDWNLELEHDRPGKGFTVALCRDAPSSDRKYAVLTDAEVKQAMGGLMAAIDVSDESVMRILKYEPDARPEPA